MPDKQRFHKYILPIYPMLMLQQFQVFKWLRVLLNALSATQYLEYVSNICLFVHMVHISGRACKLKEEKKTLFGVCLLGAIGNSISKYSSRSYTENFVDMSTEISKELLTMFVQFSTTQQFSRCNPRPKDPWIYQICNNVHQRQQAQLQAV